MTDFKLPRDLTDKCTQMLKAYYNLYILENTLRLFIENTAKSKYGEDYWGKLTIKTRIEKNIKTRKNVEKRNKTLNFRGESNIFYLDIIDLRSVFISNWDIFDDYFPNQEWITNRISELYDIRNRIAHNSFIYLSEIEQQIIETYAKSIYQQLQINESNLNLPNNLIVKAVKPKFQETSLFNRFQKLIFERDFKEILTKWDIFEELFDTNAFHNINKIADISGSEIFIIQYKFEVATMQLSHGGGKFSCNISTPDYRYISDENEEFDNAGKEFFEIIADGVNDI